MMVVSSVFSALGRVIFDSGFVVLVCLQFWMSVRRLSSVNSEVLMQFFMVY